MKRIIYCSQATSDMGADDLVEMLGSARRNNEAAGLSGMLLYCSQSFLQVLDGTPAALASVYARIAADRRHTRIRLLLEGEVSVPLFPDWTMGFEHVDDESLAEHVAGFIPATGYPLVNPDLISNAGIAVTLLKLYAKNRLR